MTPLNVLWKRSLFDYANKRGSACPEWEVSIIRITHPEWIKESPEASVSLKALASTKILVMKGKGFAFDENQLDIDHQLRFIRLYVTILSIRQSHH